MFKTPILGDTSSTQAMEKRSPGMAMGMRSKDHAKFLRGMSVLSVNHANRIARVTVITVPVPAKTKVFKIIS